jgi:hypothetical protein
MTEVKIGSQKLMTQEKNCIKLIFAFRLILLIAKKSYYQNATVVPSPTSANEAFMPIALSFSNCTICPTVVQLKQ